MLSKINWLFFLSGFSKGTFELNSIVARQTDSERKGGKQALLPLCPFKNRSRKVANIVPSQGTAVWSELKNTALTPRPTLLRFSSVKIRRLTNCKWFGHADQRIIRLQNCERVSQNDREGILEKNGRNRSIGFVGDFDKKPSNRTVYSMELKMILDHVTRRSTKIIDGLLKSPAMRSSPLIVTTNRKPHLQYIRKQSTIECFW